MPRGISTGFIGELAGGRLAPLLKRVQGDDTLCLDIRRGYINIYYRGGNLLRVSETPSGGFAASFDGKYFKDIAGVSFPEGLPPKLESPDDALKWLARFPELKQGMDLWFGRHGKDEREFQQLIVRDNNGRAGAVSTDYFILDMEYGNSENGSRFDMIGVRWPSRGAARKVADGLQLALMEVKYGDGAISSDDGAGDSVSKKAGILKHVQDLDNYLSDDSRLQALKEEMKVVWNQKRALQLLWKTAKEIGSFSDEPPEIIFILANHDPDSTRLKTELDRLQEWFDNGEPSTVRPDQIRVAAANFMGYGLFAPAMRTLDELAAGHADQVCAPDRRREASS